MHQRSFTFGFESTCSPSLKLASPHTSKIHVVVTVIVFKHSRVYGKAACNSFWLGSKRPRWRRTCSNTNSKYSFMILGRKKQVPSTILFVCIRCPHLLFGP